MMKTLNQTNSKRANGIITQGIKPMTLIFILILSLGLFTSCGSSKTAQGAGAGALVGGLVGGWDGLATGALVGGGVGLMVDAADDKQVRQEQKEREIRELKKANEIQNKQQVIAQKNANRLAGTSWRVVSLVDESKKSPEYSSLVISFQNNTKAMTLILKADGTSETYTETYTMLGDALIFTGKDYVINSEFKINGNQMIVITPDHRVVLEEIKEAV